MPSPKSFAVMVAACFVTVTLAAAVLPGPDRYIDVSYAPPIRVGIGDAYTAPEVEPPVTTQAVEAPAVQNAVQAAPQPTPVMQSAPQERAGTDEGAPAVRPTAPAAPSLPDFPTECTGHVVAPQILMRESGCSYSAFNPGGCSGRGCIGLYQLDEGHFWAVSPWNPNVSGVCFGLDYSPAGQDACASRLGPGAWG